MINCGRRTTRFWFWVALLAMGSGCQMSPLARDPGRPASTSRAPGATAIGSGSSGVPSRTPATSPGSVNPMVADSKHPVELASAKAVEAATVPLTTAQQPAPNGPVPPPRPAAPVQSSLSLLEALSLGLSQNPDLITLRGTESVSAGNVNVAGVYPWNPFVQAQYFPQGHPFTPATSPGGQAGGSNYYVWLMQRFELGHQRRHRQDGAAAAFGQVRWNIRQAELVNVAQTERLYFAAIYQRQLRDLAVDTETLGKRLLEVIERRFQAGLATTVESANARIAHRQSHRQRQLANSSYQGALLVLRQQLGLPLDAPLNPTGDLTKLAWLPIGDAFCSVAQTAPPEPQWLAAEMAQARPDVMAARFGANMAQANLDLARSARIQDVQAGPIYETADDGTRYIGLRLQREFGVFNNGSALASQREVELRQQILAHNQLQRRATNEAAAAIDRYERSRQDAAEAARETSENPTGELQQVVSQFEAGKADVVNVLAIQNNLLQDLRAHLDLANEVAQSAALVTQTTGLPPERLLASPRPEPLPAPAENPQQLKPAS